MYCEKKAVDREMEKINNTNFFQTVPVPFALAHIPHPKSHHILRWHLAGQP
jgi:hypothetical protein